MPSLIRLDAFAQANSNPLLDAITSISDDNNEIHRALLVKESRLCAVAEAALATRETTRQIEVITPSQLDSGRCFTQMIITGPAQWFSDAVFSAPRATRLDIVRFSWIRDIGIPKIVPGIHASIHKPGFSMTWMDPLG